MSDLYQSLSHMKWDCKYHVAFIPKRRRKILFGKVRRQLGEIFHALARQKECQILEGHLLPDQVHMCVAISPEALGGLRHRVPEGEECHCGGSNVWPRAELHGRAPVGSGLCRFHGRVRTGASPPIRPRTGGSGWNRRKLLIA